MGAKAIKQQPPNSASTDHHTANSHGQEYQVVLRSFAAWQNHKPMSSGYTSCVPVPEKENDQPNQYTVSSKADRLEKLPAISTNDDYHRRKYRDDQNTLPRKPLGLRRSQSSENLSSSKRVITVPEIISAQQKRRSKFPSSETSGFSSRSQKFERSTSSTKTKQLSSAQKRPKILNELQFILINSNDIKTVREIGKGNFGTVHHAVYQGSRDVALKTLNLHDANTSQSSNNNYDDHMYELLHEAGIMTRLKHANVLRILGVTFLGDKQQLSLVTEFMKNGSLLDYLRKHREAFLKSDSRSVTKKLNKLARQILEAMFYLEERSIIHRDLAARNCLIGEGDTLKVGDFGLTKLTDCGLYKGTYRTVCAPRWTSPEAIFFSKYSSRSDVWSYGITLWELYTLGDRPFPTMTNIAVRSVLANSSVNLGIYLPKPAHTGSDKTYTHVILPCLTYTAAVRPRFRDLRGTLLTVTDVV